MCEGVGVRGVGVKGVGEGVGVREGMCRWEEES